MAVGTGVGVRVWVGVGVGGFGVAVGTAVGVEVGGLGVAVGVGGTSVAALQPAPRIKSTKKQASKSFLIVDASSISILQKLAGALSQDRP